MERRGRETDGDEHGLGVAVLGATEPSGLHGGEQDTHVRRRSTYTITVHHRNADQIIEYQSALHAASAFSLMTGLEGDSGNPFEIAARVKTGETFAGPVRYSESLATLCRVE